MIIVKAPLRISLGGGGTDLPSYYERFGSMFISAAIDKYVYVSAHKNFDKDVIVKYSQVEKVAAASAVRHPIVREALKATGIDDSIELASFADIPAGTGLGSSSAFTVALLRALYAYTHHYHDALELAEDACDIEMNKVGSPIGKQDQYISAVGGISRFEIDTKGKVSVSPLAISSSAQRDLEDHIVLFFTGFSRDANAMLLEQDKATKADRDGMIANLHFVQELAISISSALHRSDLAEFGRLLNVHWEHKKKRSRSMSNDKIDAWYELAMNNGAIGGKLIGAGGGGFLMFLAEDKRRLRRAMGLSGLSEVPFRFDALGAQVVLHEE